MRPGRFIAGDPLRALAALSVLAYHMAFGAALLSTAGGSRDERFADAFGPAGRVLGNLDLGLFVFFVLSGYLLARPFLRAIVDGEPRPATGRYLRNRFLRIVPAYWFVLTVTLVLHGTVGSSPGEIASMYGFGQVYDPSPATGLMVQAWTLDVEMAFYLVLPVGAVALAWGLRGRLTPAGRLAAVLGLLAAVLVGSLVVRELGPQTDQFQRLLPSMLFAFVPGIALAALELRVPAWLRARGVAIAIGLLPIALLCFVLYAASDPHANARRALLAAAGAGALVAAPLVYQWSSGRAWRALDNPVMDWLGARSYSIYLVHYAIGIELVSLARDAGSAWGAFGITLALDLPLSLIAAALVYRFIERPFLRLRAPRPKTHPSFAAADA